MPVVVAVVVLGRLGNCVVVGVGWGVGTTTTTTKVDYRTASHFVIFIRRK